MTVRHPHADRDASPAAVTIGDTTFSITDGVVDCPPEDERHVADVLSDVYDVDAAELLEADDDVADDLEAKTSAELYEMAQERDIEGRSEMRKPDLIDALRAHED